MIGIKEEISLSNSSLKSSRGSMPCLKKLRERITDEDPRHLWSGRTSDPGIAPESSLATPPIPKVYPEDLICESE